MTGCPAYLCITVTEWPRGRLIIRQDVLVSCPPHFDLTFHVPRTSTVRQSNVPSPNSGAFQPPAPETVDNDREVVYECVLDDAKVVHRISLLVSLTSTSSSASRTTFDDYGQFPSAQNETETYRDDSLVTSVDDVHAQTAFIVVALATTVMSLRLCACGSFSDSSGSYFPLPVALLSQSKHSNGARKSNDQRQPSGSTFRAAPAGGGVSARNRKSQRRRHPFRSQPDCVSGRGPAVDGVLSLLCTLPGSCCIPSALR
jgi:hypothetical protein